MNEQPMVPTAATDLAQKPGTRFPRTFRGYDRHLVDDELRRIDARVADHERRAERLTDDLASTRDELATVRHELTRARAELRYWNDRASYVDNEVARARTTAAEIEATAKSRADSIEADAQERSLQLVDRVCREANAMLQAAREEAREMFLRFETDVDMSKQKLDKLESVRREVATTMQGALTQFEEAVRELDAASPTRRIVDAVELPTRRALPTFGTQRALEAADRFEQGTNRQAAHALSSPLPAAAPDPEALAAEVPTDAATRDDIAEANRDAQMETTLRAEVTSPGNDEAEAISSPSARAAFDADEEFASLLLQP